MKTLEERLKENGFTEDMQKRMEKGQINSEDFPVYEKALGLEIKNLGKTNNKRLESILSIIL